MHLSISLLYFLILHVLICFCLSPEPGLLQPFPPSAFNGVPPSPVDFPAGWGGRENHLRLPPLNSTYSLSIIHCGELQPCRRRSVFAARLRNDITRVRGMVSWTLRGVPRPRTRDAHPQPFASEVTEESGACFPSGMQRWPQQGRD